MQIRIKYSVTGGLRYNTETDFSKTNSVYSEGL